MSNTTECIVVDYGIGNVFSVMQALRKCGVNPTLTADPDKLRKADRVILPGVGAFKNGMQGLVDNDLIEPIREFATSGKPLLGICLGMQLFGTKSLEFGEQEGLNIIPGRTERIPHLKEDGTNRTIPFIGWREIKVIQQPSFGPSILDMPLQDGAGYLVHSFQFVADKKENLLATYEYEGTTITAAIRKDNITGVQFHPEKSAKTGLRVINAFISLS